MKCVLHIFFLFELFVDSVRGLDNIEKSTELEMLKLIIMKLPWWIILLCWQKAEFVIIYFNKLIKGVIEMNIKNREIITYGKPYVIAEIGNK